MEKQELWSATQETALDPGSCAKTLKLQCVCVCVYVCVCVCPAPVSLFRGIRKEVQAGGELHPSPQCSHSVCTFLSLTVILTERHPHQPVHLHNIQLSASGSLLRFLDLIPLSFSTCFCDVCNNGIGSGFTKQKGIRLLCSKTERTEEQFMKPYWLGILVDTV